MNQKITVFRGLAQALLVLLLLAPPAWGLDLQAAKDRGWIGEMSTGYVGLVDNSAPGDAAGLVQSVNVRRKEIYARKAVENGVATSAIEKIAAEQNIRKTESGHFVNVDGRWSRKP